MIDTQSWVALAVTKSKGRPLSWTTVICSIGLDFATCLLSHGVLAIPFAFLLCGWATAGLLVGLCMLSAYAFHALHCAMESPPVRALNISLMRMNYGFLASMALGPMGAALTRGLQFLDTVMSGVYLFAILVVVLQLVLGWAHSTVVVAVVLMSSIFGFSNEPHFFFSDKWWATPLCFGLMLVGLPLSTVEWGASGGAAAAAAAAAVPAASELGTSALLPLAGDLWGNAALSFGIIVHCLAGATSAPHMYVYVVSASRKVTGGTSDTTKEQDLVIQRDGSSARFFLGKSRLMFAFAMAVVCLVYLVFGSLGFWLHGSQVQPSFALNLVAAFNANWPLCLTSLGPTCGCVLLLAALLVLMYSTFSVLPLVVATVDTALVREQMGLAWKTGLRVLIVAGYWGLGLLIEDHFVPLVCFCGSSVVALYTFLLPIGIHFKLNWAQLSYIELVMGSLCGVAVLFLTARGTLLSVQLLLGSV